MLFVDIANEFWFIWQLNCVRSIWCMIPTFPSRAIVSKIDHNPNFLISIARNSFTVCCFRLWDLQLKRMYVHEIFVRCRNSIKFDEIIRSDLHSNSRRWSLCTHFHVQISCVQISTNKLDCERCFKCYFFPIKRNILDVCVWCPSSCFAVPYVFHSCGTRAALSVWINIFFAATWITGLYQLLWITCTCTSKFMHFKNFIFAHL